MMEMPNAPVLNYDVVVIGGGPAGMSASIEAGKLGLKVLLLNEKPAPGTNLGLFGGNELREKLAAGLEDAGVDVITSARALEIGNRSDLEKYVLFSSPMGLRGVRTGAVIYAAGSRERHAFEVGIVGDRGAGVYTVGEAMELISLGVLPGRNVVIGGSHDSALHLASRLAEEGTVTIVDRRIEGPPQCLGRAGLMTGASVVEVRGRRRVERVGVDLGDRMEWLDADTLIVGAEPVPAMGKLVRTGALVDPATGGPLVSEWLETSVPGIFAAGNSLGTGYDPGIAVEQGTIAARGVLEFIEMGGIRNGGWARVFGGEGVKFVFPQLLGGGDATLYVRPEGPLKNGRLEIPELGIETRVGDVIPSRILRVKLRGVDLKPGMKVRIMMGG